tara:strand:- start:326 stop:1240 length:915 start_codon:yes stop_codon:yes gene_type:complete
MKKTFLIDEESSNSRLDRWLKRNVFNVPQSLIEKNLRKGNIKVNNKKNKSSYKLRLNDSILVQNINFTPNLNKKNVIKYIPTKKDLSFSSNLFIENNENFVVINKPSGIAVQGGTKSRRNLLDILSKTKEFYGTYPYPVHRIDKETTGVLIISKNRKYAQLFTSLFRIRKIYKTYLGIVIGNFDKNKGTLVDILNQYEGKKIIKSKAITNFEVIDSNNNYSLVKLNPITGRKHQLRKQLLIRGHPILGDSKYRIKENNNIKKSQLMLHAYKINFTINSMKYRFIAELPNEFKNFLKEKYLKNFF